MGMTYIPHVTLTIRTILGPVVGLPLVSPRITTQLTLKLTLDP